jgi:hypothetical protein
VFDLDNPGSLGVLVWSAIQCQACYGGPQWTLSKVRYVPPAAPGFVTGGSLIGELRNVGTFSPFVRNEVRSNVRTPLGASELAPTSLLGVAAPARSFLPQRGGDGADRRPAERDASERRHERRRYAVQRIGSGQDRALPRIDRRGHGPIP